MLGELKINKEIIVNILKNRDKKLEIIQDQRKKVYVDIENTDQNLQDSVLGHCQKNGSSKTRMSDPLLAILNQEQRLIKEKILLAQEELIMLTEQEEQIQRIWICFKKLPLKEYMILEKLYVKKEKFISVRESFAMNQRYFLKTIKNGINNILLLYKSDYSNREIQKIMNFPEKKKIVISPFISPSGEQLELQFKE